VVVKEEVVERDIDELSLQPEVVVKEELDG